MSKKSRSEASKESRGNSFATKRTYFIGGLGNLLKEIKGHAPNKAFADRLKLSERTLSDLERTSAISRANWHKVCEAFEGSEEYLHRLQSLCPEGWGRNSQPVQARGLKEIHRIGHYGKVPHLQKRVRWPVQVSRDFVDDVVKVHTSDEVQNSVLRVVTHKEYPLWMSIGGRLVLNPVWENVSDERLAKLRHDYGIGGETPPTVMRQDMLLIRRNDRLGKGELFTYPGWETKLVTFRPWLPDDEPQQRDYLNSAHLAKYWGVAPEDIEIKAIPGKFAVSAKQHFQRKDLVLYIFEICSVRFKGTSEELEMFRSQDPNHTNSGPWRDLKSLRDDLSSFSVNGDLIWALNMMFGVSLGPIPHSFSSAK
jgi:hypothetical protein